MKINFSKGLKDQNGGPLLDQDGKEILLYTPCINALYGTYPDESGISGEEKYKRYSLAKKIDKVNDTDLSVEDISLIKKMIGKAYPPYVVGTVYDMLEGVE